jgi:hypothetical protein
MAKQLRIEYNLQYDPKDVDIRVQHFTVDKIIKMIENGDLEIYEENDLQRLAGIWDEKRKSLLIESLMISLPLPMFYLDGSDKPWRVIDGLQRLTTLFQYISPQSNDPFELKNLEYLKEEFNRYPFNDLPLNMQRRILEAPIEAYVINPGTPPAVKYNIFQRINTKGLPLTGQEVRNAVYRGIPSDFTKELALLPEFKKATNNKVSVKRMVDREYVNRFIAFQLYKDQYIADIDEFLRLAMQTLYDVSKQDLNQLKDNFILSMNRSHDLLGAYAFYRIDKNGKPGRGPNKALYDTLAWNLVAINDNEFAKLKDKKESFRKLFIKLQHDNLDFFKAINDTTSSKTNVKNRFDILQSFIQEQL